MAVTITRPDELSELKTAQPAWVVLYNDDWHSFDDVIGQLVKAGACNRDEAELHAWRVHREGRSRVFSGVREDCERVAGILREIRLQVEVDWND